MARADDVNAHCTRFRGQLGPRTGPRFIASSGGRWLPNVIIGRQSADVRFARGSFFRAASGRYVTLAELQAALDAWVADYNTARPHQSCGGRPPAERFRFADRSITPDAPAGQPAAAASRAAAGSRPPGVSRWVNTHGKISLGGFAYAAGASYAGEPVEAVVAGSLVEILHAGVVIAAHAQRFREDQADRSPRMQVARRARDATVGLTVTRLANGNGVVSFAGADYQAGRGWARQAIDVRIVAGSV
jgi:hypothetical protein